MRTSWLDRILGRHRRAGDGRWGEDAAADFLRTQGYEILARNFRVRGGEADLLALKDGLLVVVEVKARRSRSFGSAAEAVGEEKSTRVMRAGRVYCRAHGISLGKLRGDVVTVEAYDESLPPVIRHLPGALVAAHGRR